MHLEQLEGWARLKASVSFDDDLLVDVTGARDSAWTDSCRRQRRIFAQFADVCL